MYTVLPDTYHELPFHKRIKYNVRAIRAEIIGDAEALLSPGLNNNRKALEIAYDDDGYSYVRPARKQTTKNRTDDYKKVELKPLFNKPALPKSKNDNNRAKALSPININKTGDIKIDNLQGINDDYNDNVFDPLILIPCGIENMVDLSPATPAEIKRYAKSHHGLCKQDITWSRNWCSR